MHNTKTKTMEKTALQSKNYNYKTGEVTIEILKDLILQSYIDEYNIKFYNDSICIKYNNNRYDIFIRNIERIRILDNVCVEISSSNYSITMYDGIKSTHTIFF